MTVPGAALEHGEQGYARDVRVHLLGSGRTALRRDVPQSNRLLLGDEPREPARDRLRDLGRELRGRALPLFRRFVEASRARLIEVQSNDLLATLMLYDCASGIESNVVLFRDAIATSLRVPGAVVREVTEADKELIESRKLDADAGWLVEADGEVAATSPS